MKVLQVNCVYKNGSTGKIVYDLHRGLLDKGISSVVCYGRGKKEDGYKVCGELYAHIQHFMANLTGVMYGGCRLSTRKLLSVIKKEQPDIVHLHCINGYFVNIYRLVNWLKKKKIKTVLTLHAEFMYTGGCGHAVTCEQWCSPKGCGQARCPRLKGETGSWLFDRTGTMWRKMKKAFEGFDENLTVVSVSPWLQERAERSPILAGKKHTVVFNGLDGAVFYPRSEESGLALKKELKIEGEKVIFHATPEFSADPNHIKGGYYLIELAKKMPEIKFVVAGMPQGELSLPENMLLLGRVSDQERLASLYSMADLTLLTSLRETFSMITAESLSCGTPIVGFKAGAPERIALEGYSQFVDFGDLDGLKAAAEKMLQTPIDKETLRQKASIYAKESMVEGYLRVYNEL